MKRIFSLASLVALGILLLAGLAYADSSTAVMYQATPTGEGAEIGTVTFTDGSDGLLIQTDLKGLAPGMHGFHVHAKGDCSPTTKDGKVTPAGAAGGHLDPMNTGKHLGPGGGGHLGDLPILNVEPNGTAKVKMTLKGVKASDFKGHAVMIHAGGDNYSDMPAALGGGGGRMACGIAK
jgi:Cu-Zn family superoxide dismutase